MVARPHAGPVQARRHGADHVGQLPVAVLAGFENERNGVGLAFGQGIQAVGDHVLVPDRWWAAKASNCLPMVFLRISDEPPAIS